MPKKFSMLRHGYPLARIDIKRSYEFERDGERFAVLVIWLAYRRRWRFREARAEVPADLDLRGLAAQKADEHQCPVVLWFPPRQTPRYRVFRP